MKDFLLVLASGSRYRRELLERLGLPFQTWSPDIDESAHPGEAPIDTARRLSRAKAEAGAARFANAWVIGSDQVADLGGQAIGKPGTHDKAREQLRSMRGKTVLFHTGLCVANAARVRVVESLVTTEVAFRQLSDTEIERYLDREPAFDCAGAAKSEALGISLLERLSGDDPTALVGLPLIALCGMLRAEGLEIP
ncbi:Maf family protein [Usitatibacter palustris]|uniref:7-methyl-GTP pyrophosphatase n=1 Tax=Usitatibacter palustris TaxID=2732487 RepID=A0A6M4H9Y9_9PROT|nr:Maf family nucleotide pyrophosphatase [Usitatibacter palustris]QJR15214.1 7-methyl-GTP pyrophosphatase [Usitatibacter palustris]